MVDDWMRKYLVIAGHAPPRTHEEPHREEPAVKQELPVVAKKPAEPISVPPAAEEPAKKPVRKRTVKKELNDAAKKPKKKSVKKAAEKKDVPKRKRASHKPE